MARLAGLPEFGVLMNQASRRDSGVRLGQFVWNTYGQYGIDRKGWPELFYAEDKKAIEILRNYYEN